VIAMFASLLLLLFLPWLDTSKVRSTSYRPVYRFFFWLLLADMFILGYIGAMPAEEPYVRFGQLATMYYFAHFLIILPIVSAIEKPLPLPNSIADSVFAKAKKIGTAAPSGAVAQPAE
jgi:ubiquinol-cytochrome c reductase cytochrome b subunit